jgi:N-acetylglucosaminyl-diphospho-decaprenol L-rhamnosyltransferase
VLTDLAVVVVTYNSAHVIDDLLDSLTEAFRGHAADVVIVDNDSVDETRQRVEQRGDARLIRSANVGYAGGINRGVREAKDAQAILILNPDVRMLPGSVAQLLRTLSSSRTGIVAPQVRAPDGSLDHSLRRDPSLPRALGLNWTGLPFLAEYVLKDEEYASGRVVDWALGAVLLISRECYDAVGGWDESYFLYSEETDFCLRARDLGYLTRYDPEAVAVHIGGQSGQNDKTHAMQILNRVRFYRRRHSTAAAWLYYAATIASECSWILRGHRQSRFAVRALLRPQLRPAELACGPRLLPS